MSGKTVKEVLSDVDISTIFMRHTEGTKFYESMWLRDKSRDQSVIVNRWGSLASAAKRGGGTLKFKILANGKFAPNYREKVIDSKEKRGYRRAGAQTYDGKEVDDKFDFLIDRGILYPRGALKPDSDLNRFFEECGYGKSTNPAVLSFPWDETDEKLVAPIIPKAEVNRSTSWGSW